MNTKLNIKMIVMLLLVVAVSAVYAKSVITVDSCEFEELSAQRKQKARQIQSEFGDEVHRILLDKNNDASILLLFDKELQDKKKPQKISDAFTISAKSMRINDKDSNSRKKVIGEYENVGLQLLTKAGYRSRPGFTIKIDTNQLESFGPLSKKTVLGSGWLDFNEFYNGILIERKSAVIGFYDGKISNIRLKAFANMDIRITKSEPDLSFHEALRKYLSLKKTKVDGRPTGSLHYILNSQRSLVLCWKIDLMLSGNDDYIVWVNAETGQIEREIETTVRGISGTVKAYYYMYGDRYKTSPEQCSYAEAVPFAQTFCWGGGSSLTGTTAANGGYSFEGLTKGTGYEVGVNLWQTGVGSNVKTFKVLSAAVSGEANATLVNSKIPEYTYKGESGSESTDHKINPGWPTKDDPKNPPFTAPTIYHWWPFIYDFFKQWKETNGTLTFDSWTSPMEIIVDADESKFVPSTKKIYIEQMDGKFPSTLYHEYTHAMIYARWSKDLAYSSDYKTRSLGEAISDFIACQYTGETALWDEDIRIVRYLKQDLVSKYTYDKYGYGSLIMKNNYHEASQVLSGALYDAKIDGPRWDNATSGTHRIHLQGLIWHALRWSFESSTEISFPIYFSGLLVADYQKNGGTDPTIKTATGFTPHAYELCKAFYEKHKISPDGKLVPADYCIKCLQAERFESVSMPIRSKR